MWIENVITSFIREKNNRYLHFTEDKPLDIPVNSKDKKYLLYVHIPFCEKLCPYCSFNRYPYEETLTKSYFKSLRREIKLYHEKGYDCAGLYIGGGTPTILLDELEETLKLIRRLFSIREVSLETNPNHLTKEKLEILKSMGINRLSVGVQSFDDDILRSIDRYEKYGSGLEIQDKLRMALGNFHTLNVDMIFNFPNQSMDILERDLDIILNLQVDQVTFYPLMVATSTQQAISQKLGKIDYKKEKAFYFKILEKLSIQFSPATAWCFSKTKSMIDEYIVDYDEYLGLGSGAFGYLAGCIYANTFSLQEYISELQQDRFPLMSKKNFSIKEQIRYDFLMKLFGGHLKIEEIRAKFRGNFYKYLWMEVLFFKLTGGIKTSHESIMLTPRGQYYWVIMMREFFVSVNNFRDYCRSKIMGG